MYRNVTAEDLDFQAASVLILAQIFLNSRYNYGIDSSMDGPTAKRKKRGAYKEEHGMYVDAPPLRENCLPVHNMYASA